MLSWVIQITVISVILIFLVHHLINFFKATLTVPKIKDLVNSPTQKYQNIYDTISHKSNSNSNSYTAIDLLPPGTDTTLPDDTNMNMNMKDELKSFLKKQLVGETNNVLGVDSLSGNFSNF
jgi:hypothetical protein